MKNGVNKFPHGIEEICKTFNATIKESTLNHPAFGAERPVWAIETAKGRLTPYYFALQALEVYVCSAKGKSEINKVAGEVFPAWDSEFRMWRK